MKDGTDDGGQLFRWRTVMEMEGVHGYLGCSKKWRMVIETEDSHGILDGH